MRREIEVSMHELEPCNLVAWCSKEALDLPYSMPRHRYAEPALPCLVSVSWRLEFALREVVRDRLDSERVKFDRITIDHPTVVLRENRIGGTSYSFVLFSYPRVLLLNIGSPDCHLVRLPILNRYRVTGLVCYPIDAGVAC